MPTQERLLSKCHLNSGCNGCEHPTTRWHACEVNSNWLEKERGRRPHNVPAYSAPRNEAALELAKAVRERDLFADGHFAEGLGLVGLPGWHQVQLYPAAPTESGGMVVMVCGLDDQNVRVSTTVERRYVQFPSAPADTVYA